jgi:hypothetical protein
VINQSYDQLVEQVAHLRASLEEANETLQAIRLGQVDAVVVQGSRGDQLFTLKGADEPYRVVIEEITREQSLSQPTVSFSIVIGALPVC